MKAKKQEEALREFLHEAVVPLIEDVLVKKLGQAISYAAEQRTPPKRKPVAWRRQVNGIWFYLDGDDPFPVDGYEPLFV